MTEARKWVAVDFGGPEVLRTIDVDVPDPGPGQVTIGVLAAGMNPADAKHIAAGQERKLLPLSIGMNEAGDVSVALVGDRKRVVTIAAARGPGRRVRLHRRVEPGKRAVPRPCAQPDPGARPGGRAGRADGADVQVRGRPGGFRHAHEPSSARQDRSGQRSLRTKASPQRRAVSSERPGIPARAARMPDASACGMQSRSLVPGGGRLRLAIGM